MRINEQRKYLLNAGKIISDIGLFSRYDFIYDLMPIHLRHIKFAKKMNMLRAGMNLIHRRTSPWSWPMHMHIELASYCNIHCTVCPTGTGRLMRPPAAMDPDLFGRLFNEVSPYLLTCSLWGWGEPLLHPQLTEILRHASGKGVVTLLSTNGQKLADEKVTDALIEYPPSYLIVCIDGTTDETNSRFRRGAKIEPALEGVKRLARLKQQRNQQFPVLHLRYIVMKHNEHELPGLREFAVSNQFDMMTIRTLSIIDAPDDIHRDMIPEDERFRAYSYKQDERIRRSDFICEKCFTFPGVFADGTVVPCDQDCNAQHPLGKISKDTSFASVWWNKQSRAIRRTIRDNPDDFSFCHNCPFRDRPVSTCSIEYYDLKK